MGYVGKLDSQYQLRMIAPTKKAQPTHIIGADLERFVIKSALLNLIDPVRGEPTRSLLEENPDGDISVGQRLNQKFLDSFAFICSTSSSGAETASAVCLEQHAPAGSILRVARNRGFTPKDLSGLEKVLQILREVSRKDKSSTQAEPEILLLVVELDKDRILSIAEWVEKRGIRSSVREAHSRLLSGQMKPETRVMPELRLWLESCPFTAAPVKTWSPATVARLIHWASQARWSYSKQLQSLLGLRNTQTTPWLDPLHKIARYYSAIKSMLKLAAKQPGVFQTIQIQEVKAYNSRQFYLSNEGKPLLSAVKTLVGEDSRSAMEQLEKHLGTQDVEARLRKACRLNLTLHAEMQLVVFYEGNPRLAPRMPFIGTSKKACFLCNEYLQQHPLRLQVSACHQKIYPSWMPPPYFPTPEQSKSVPLFKLGNIIQQVTRRELKTALAAPRRPRNQDSTAGPSLTITATVSTDLRQRQEADVQFVLKTDSLSEDLE